MSKFKTNLIKFNKILLITFLFFLFFDLILGKFIYKKFLRKNFTDVHHNTYIESSYDHTLDRELDVIWGSPRYRICTDKNGFREFVKTDQAFKKKILN